MAMKHVSIEQLKVLQHNANNIRNVCILAHVDHGKTTLADCLIASNGIISSKMAGKLRYMDSRKDEQERGITMKSSSISLYYKDEKEEEYLINLIDSPGHVDFSSEVSTAVRLCDGAIIMVDCVEGVCAQTQVALKQAWLERISPILVLNKIDRLILEMKLAPLDIYVHLSQLVEQVNAVMGELFASQVLEDDEKKEREDMSNAREDGIYTDWGTGLEDMDDSDLYFSPDRNNVVFASAYDGWGFTLEDFAQLYSSKLGIRVELLRKTLWGDFYLNTKAKRIMRGAQEKAKSPLFVDFVLKNIVTIYETIMVRRDKEKASQIAESLGVRLTTRDLRHADPRVTLQTLMSTWLPVCRAVLRSVKAHCRAPSQLSGDKVEKLLTTSHVSYSHLPPSSQALKSHFLACSSDPPAPLVVFISKMFTVERKQLPENRQKPLTREEMDARREAVKARLAARALGVATETKPDDTGPIPGMSFEPRTPDKKADESSVETAAEIQESEEAFIAFARVYSGTVRKGDSVYVLGPKHDPTILQDKIQAGQEITIEEGRTLKDLKPGCHVTRVKLNHIYLLMGRELCEMDEVPAGNMLGIGGLEEHVLKSATLSSELACPSFSELLLMATPILRVALEPVHPSDLATLVRGLRLLNQADACVEVILQESGEHVLVTAGEVHLQRCLDDLRERYARVEFSVSEPIVPFRETIIPPPLKDMINESIVPLPSYNEKKDQDSKDQQWVTVHTQDQSYRFRIEAIPLPEKVILLLERNTAVFKAYHKDKTKVNKKVTGIEESLHSLSISNHTVTSPSCDEVRAPSDIQTTDSSRTSHVNSSNSTCDSSGGQVSQSINEDNQSTIGNLESKLTSERNSSNTTAQESRSEIQNAECKSKQSVESNGQTESLKSTHRIRMSNDTQDEMSRSTHSIQSLSNDTQDETLRSTHSIQSLSNDTQDASLIKEMLRIKSELRVLLKEEKATAALNEEDLDNIVSFGPRYCGPNVLINCVQDLHHSIWPTLSPQHPDTGDIERLDHLTSVVNGFQLATLAGPLCEEPMMGVGFRLLEWSRLDRVVNSNTFYGPISGQIMTIIKEGCRRAFQIQPQRLMAAMYTCNIQVSSEVLGKVYAVLGRRHGRIVYNDAQNSVQAYLPVLESFSFAPEIRKSTSGLASPQLVFSHWEVINIDPFWEPNTEEEYVHFGDKADTENRARTYMNSVRRRKGLPVQENLVTHGEKQRTVKKNK